MCWALYWKGWKLWLVHPKNSAMFLAAVFFFVLLLVSVAASGLSQPPSWLLTVTAILSVLGGSCFAASLSMRIYEFITKQGQEDKYNRDFAVDLVKTLYGPLYDELMKARDRLTLNYDLLGLDQLQSLHWKYLRLLVPGALIDSAEALEAMVAEYSKVFQDADGTLNKKGAQIARSFAGERGETFDVQLFSGNKDTLSGGEWRAVLGTGDSGMKANFDRLADAVSKAVSSGKANGAITRKFMDEFIEGIKSEPLAGRIVELRDSLCASISDVVAKLKPLIQTPYLGKVASS